MLQLREVQAQLRDARETAGPTIERLVRPGFTYFTDLTAARGNLNELLGTCTEASHYD